MFGMHFCRIRSRLPECHIPTNTVQHFSLYMCEQGSYVRRSYHEYFVKLHVCYKRTPFVKYTQAGTGIATIWQ